MNAKDTIREVVEFSYMVVHSYVDDLPDGALMVRVVPRANHIAWQLGHMIAGTQQMIAALGHSPPPLPKGFAEKYTKETSASDDPAQFAGKAECLALVDQMKAATLAVIDATPEASLDQPAPEEMREYAPTVGSALLILGSHWLMHAGQFVPIRRKLGKPPLF
jgi:hypothetical protein